MIVSCLAAASLLQTTRVVDDDGGPGVAFTDLPAAVAASADGDVLLVRPGHYTHFVLSGKGLDLVAQGAVRVDRAGAAGQQTTIADVPLRSHVLLDGFEFPGPAVCGQSRLAITGASTRATLIDVVVTGQLNACGGPLESSALQVSSARVVLARVALTGGPGFRDGHNGSSGGCALLTTDGARVHVVDSTLFGGAGVAGDLYAGPGGPGLRARSGSRAWIADSESTGGPGTLGASGITGVGGAGIAADGAARVRVSGDGGRRISGGTAYENGGIGVSVTDGARVVVHAVEVWTGVAFFGPPPHPQIVGFDAAPPLPTLRADGRFAPEGSLELDLTAGAASAPFLLWVEGGAPFPQPLPSANLVGEFAFRPDLVHPLFAGTLSPAGDFHTSVPLASFGAGLHQAVRLQALVGTSGGTMQLSNPVAFSLRPLFDGRYTR